MFSSICCTEDNVIEIDNFKFNVANVTEFVDYAHEDNESYVSDSYVDANKTG